MTMPATAESTQHLDPFAVAPKGAVPRRPRLFAHAGRTGRARRWLPDDARRVLDVGCASGYGTSALAADDRHGIGVEVDPGHLALARRLHPWLTVIEGDAGALPVPGGCADAVLLLDVIEHLADPGAALAEAHRALRPGGTLILSVPHRGPLTRLDALNLYAALRRRRPAWPPLEEPTRSGSGEHRHFSPAELEALLRPWFRVRRTTRTGVGAAELLAFARLLLRANGVGPRLAATLGYLYIAAYLAEDVVPLGPLGYHLTVMATAVPPEGAA
jgi:SAM-dependent methyltransferase